MAEHDLDQISDKIHNFVCTFNQTKAYQPHGVMYGSLRTGYSDLVLDGVTAECFGNIGDLVNRTPWTGLNYYFVIPYVTNPNPKEVDSYGRGQRPLLDPSSDSPYRHVIDFVLKYDPWQIVPYLVCTDPQWIQENGWVFKSFREIPCDQVYAFSMFASRYMKLNKQNVCTWLRIKDTMNPRRAMILANMCQLAGRAYRECEDWTNKDLIWRPSNGPAWLEGLQAFYVYRFMTSQPKHSATRGISTNSHGWSRCRASYLFRKDWNPSRIKNHEIVQKGGSFEDFSTFIDEVFEYQKGFV